MRIQASSVLFCAAVASLLHIWSCTGSVTNPGDGGQCPEGYMPYGDRCIKVDGDAGGGDGGEQDAAGQDGGGGDGGGMGDGGGSDSGSQDGGAMICDPGTKKCENELLKKCNDLGLAWEIADDCSERCDPSVCVTGCSVDGCVTAPVICNPMDTKCCDDVSHLDPPCSCVKEDLCICDAKGLSWTVEVQCGPTPNYCHISQCNTPIKICTAGEQKCAGSTRMECKPDGSGWNTAEKCAGCCSQSGKTATCKEGTGTDAAKCTTDCDCKAGYICVGFSLDNSKVCRRICSLVNQCPDGFSCTTGYYCAPN